MGLEVGAETMARLQSVAKGREGLDRNRPIAVRRGAMLLKGRATAKFDETISSRR